MAKPSKYRNKWTVVDGIKFQSQREAKRYTELKMLERAGKIHVLNLQPKFPCYVKEELICTHIGDFDYFDEANKYHLEDSKGYRTSIYNLKKKLVKAIFGVVIEEV